MLEQANPNLTGKKHDCTTTLRRQLGSPKASLKPDYAYRQSAFLSTCASLLVQISLLALLVNILWGGEV